MIKSCIFNQSDFQQFIDQYLVKKKSYEIYLAQKQENNQNFTKQVIQTALAKKMKNYILDLQTLLYKSRKITSLPMYDRASETLYRGMIQIRNILELEQDIANFIESLRLSQKLQGGIGLIHEKNYHGLNSMNKLRIYQQFVKEAETKDLFTKSLHQKIAKVDIDQLVSQPELVFPKRDHQLLYQCLKLTPGRVDGFYFQVRNLGLHKTNKVYSRDVIYKKLNNMLMIGLYQLYKTCLNFEKAKYMRWPKFALTRKIQEQFKPYYHILFRFAIRKDVTYEEGKQFCFMISRSFVVQTDEKKRLRNFRLLKHIQKHVIKKRISENMKKIYLKKQGEEQQSDDGKNKVRHYRKNIIEDYLQDEESDGESSAVWNQQKYKDWRKINKKRVGDSKKKIQLKKQLNTSQNKPQNQPKKQRNSFRQLDEIAMTKLQKQIENI